MTNIHIPPEAVLGMAKAIAKVRYQQDVWAYLGENEQEICLMEAEAAARAMLAAWPGMEHMAGDEAFPFYYLILPLNTENPDA